MIVTERHTCWMLHRRGLTAVCEVLPHPRGFELVLTIKGIVINNVAVRSVPGTEAQVKSWMPRPRIS